MGKAFIKWGALATVLAVMLMLCLGACAKKAEPPAPEEGLAIDEVNFPDPAFRAYVAAGLDQNQGGALTPEEIAAVRELDVGWIGAASLQGLEYFSALESLRCQGNQLTELDISKNAGLQYLRCYENRLTALDISQNANLEVLECYSNQLTEVDISQNSGLIFFSCFYNQLTELDISQNDKLTVLACSHNQLTGLDTAKNINLVLLNCSNNQLTALDISKNIRLAELDYSFNRLTALDAGHNSRLTALKYEGNPLKLAYTDVKEGDWYYAGVFYVHFNNLISATGAAFSPGLPASRAVLVNALYRHANCPEADDVASPFSDVPDNADYAEAVRWAAANGIVSGRGDGVFDPEGSITRRDLAVIFLRYLKYAAIDKPVTAEYIMFSDEGQISDYAKEAMQTLYKLDIIRGVGGNAVDPKGIATRAQLAEMLRRFLELAEDEEQ